MKWLGGVGGGDGMVRLEMENGSRGPQRTQDDAAVGYVFQRPPDPEFPQFGPKQARWALGDDSIIDNHDKWKYSINNKMATPPNSMSYMGPGTTTGNAGMYHDNSNQQQNKGIPPEHQLVYLSNQMGLPGMAPMPQYIPQQMPLRTQIAPAAKKLWGLEGKDGKGLTLHHLNHEQVWRDPTWAAPVEHAVSAPLPMGRRGGFAGGGDTGGGILSPRGSDTGGLGVKMVEYVLGTSPTAKEALGLEPRMRALGLDDKDKDKPVSPKEDCVNGAGPVTNGVGDDDKGFNRTPGSRQPSPAEEELTKNGGLNLQPGVVILKPEEHLPPHLQHLPPHLAPHLGVTLADTVNQHFEHFEQQPPPSAYEQQHLPGQYPQPPPPPQHQVDNAAVIQQQQHNFDVQESGSPIQAPAALLDPLDYRQTATCMKMLPKRYINVHQWLGPVCPKELKAQIQLFRSQQTQAAQPSAAQLQLLQQQQQQYLAQQQPAFAQPPYVLNPSQEQPYLITAGVPQYYGVAPWVYPANLIQQGASNGARRPLTPSGVSGEPQPQVQPQVQSGYIVPYYDQNAPILMAQGAAMRNGTPMRLVSPAPVLVQPQASRQTPAGASLYSNTPQSLYGASVNTSVNGGTLGGVAQGVGSGLFPTLHAAPSAPFGSGSLGTIGSPATTTSLHTGLGLSTSSTGRRDSFDRNTSAFSPSLEYRPKWPASYGLGSSPSPLTGSLTPPPSTPLQLGGLVNSRVLSAAPGAEAKFRNSVAAAGLTAANTMFGSTNSLFTKINSALTTVASASTLDKGPQGRSRLLEDFRNNRFPNLQLRDLANHIVEFSQDQHGSRFIQQKLERATVAEKQMVFSEILSAAYNLMTDVFGNYVIQKFFEFGTPEQKTTLAQKVRGHVLPLALQMYGCRVIQKALESISPEHQQEIVRELDGHVLKCVKDQNGNHVVQKCIECVEPMALQFVIASFAGQVYSLSTHPYGCRVIQRILEHCTAEQTAPILAELHAHTDQLIQDQFGNYVIQHVLEHGKPEDKSQLISSVRGKVLVLSQHKFASNVVEKCVTHATRAERALLIEEVCGFNDNALHVMMKDQYANYVVQKMIDVSEPTQRKVLMHKIRPHLNSLRKYTYGKHIIAKLEKFFMKSPGSLSAIGGELGPIGPPTNGVL